jgi:hypothetical protein
LWFNPGRANRFFLLELGGAGIMVMIDQSARDIRPAVSFPLYDLILL